MYENKEVVSGGGGGGGGEMKELMKEEPDFDSEFGPDSESGTEAGRQRAKKFDAEDIALAYQLMDELDPNELLASQKWGDGSRELKEQGRTRDSAGFNCTFEG